MKPTMRDAVDEMTAIQVDGIIYLGSHSHSVFSLPKPENVPCVCAYCYSADPQIPSVQYNDRLGAYRATELLINTGHMTARHYCGTAGLRSHFRTSSWCSGGFVFSRNNL